MREALHALAIFGGGLGVGVITPNSPFLQELPSLLLIAMIFCIGLEVTSDRSHLSQIKEHSFYVFLLPVLVAVGSLLGGILAAGILPGMTIQDSLLASAGLGYYSLAGVMVSAQYSVLIGAIALLSNVFREVITLLAAPFLVRYFGKTAVIAAGAATAMDMTLPIIRQTAGPRAVYPAFVTGLVLTIAVPFLIGGIMQF